jgi:hypothetical protein
MEGGLASTPPTPWRTQRLARGWRGRGSHPPPARECQRRPPGSRRSASPAALSKSQVFVFVHFSASLERLTDNLERLTAN